MDPVTHLLTSATLGRAGVTKIVPLAMPMLLTSGVVADADWATRLMGAETFLRWHRTASHSLLAASAATVVVALAFVLVGRIFSSQRVAILPALLVCAMGTSSHLLLDLLNPDGVSLLWPFSPRRYALDIVNSIDAWITLLLLAGILLPELFRLVRSEIGSTSDTSARRGGAVACLAFVGLFIAARVVAHQRAKALLDSREYASQTTPAQTPLLVGAFPTTSNPFAWLGVVATDDTIGNVDVSLLPGAAFNPDAAVIHYKPEDSSVLRTAENTRAAKIFLDFARFPLASVEPQGDGFRVRMRDMRFEGGWNDKSQIVAVVDLHAQGLVVSERLEFAKPGRR